MVVGPRGFMRGAFLFACDPARRWSPAGVAVYEILRAQADALISTALAVGFVGVCLEDGVALAVRAGDPRPHWSLLEDAATDLFAAQAARLAAER